MNTLRLTNIEFYAYHGCLEHEKVVGNRFRVDFECEYPMLKAAQSDNLDDALNYADIFEIIKAQMDIPSNLLENVAYRILQSVKLHFSQITSATVTIYKYRPPVDGQVETSSITLTL
ncbi:MAG: dihydroneopterin aldolase [Bacteroidales bacterium]|nr:dihydroneopterin aldolase [Bacteroidales bacterium]MDD4670132.1 dihydroneopterin aldolase [Bacteroidales bacterium]